MAAEVPAFEIIIENEQPVCNICAKKFETPEQSPHDLAEHTQSDAHQVALKKLESQPKPTILMNTIIIFDFDDTLFPTAKFTEISGRPTKAVWPYKFASNATSEEVNALAKMSYHTYQLLSAYIKLYTKRNICIVTASGPDWLKETLLMVYHIGWYKDIYHLIFDPNEQDNDDKILIYSPADNQFTFMARMVNLQKYHHISPDPATLYKYQMFVHIFNQKSKGSKHDQIINTFVIIGDSLFEYEAAKLLNEQIESEFGKNNKNIFVDRIKLMNNPTIDTLIEEQNVLCALGQNRYYENYSFIGNRFRIDLSN